MLVFKGLKIKACNAYRVFNHSLLRQRPLYCGDAFVEGGFQGSALCVSAHV